MQHRVFVDHIGLEVAGFKKLDKRDDQSMVGVHVNTLLERRCSTFLLAMPYETRAVAARRWPSFSSQPFSTFPTRGKIYYLFWIEASLWNSE